jgi:death-on-curing protein
MTWRWLQPETVLGIHDAQLAEHGGAPGVRDMGLLSSALARPRNLAAYGQPDLADLAAAYAVGVIANHPFVDGNKRTGYVVCRLFLAKHGAELVAPLSERLLVMLQVATGDMDESGLAAWLRANSRALDG